MKSKSAVAYLCLGAASAVAQLNLGPSAYTADGMCLGAQPGETNSADLTLRRLPHLALFELLQQPDTDGQPSPACHHRLGLGEKTCTGGDERC